MKIKIPQLGTIPVVNHIVELGPESTQVYWIVFKAWYERCMNNQCTEEYCLTTALMCAEKAVVQFIKQSIL